MPRVARRHAPYLHKLSHSGENGTDAIGLSVSSGGPSHVQSLRPRKTWQEATGPTHDRSMAFAVSLLLIKISLTVYLLRTGTPRTVLCAMQLSRLPE